MIKKNSTRSRITFIYVTHDQEEALTSLDKIVIMKSGEFKQVGTPQKYTMNLLINMLQISLVKVMLFQG